MKLGEEARVDFDRFTLEGPRGEVSAARAATRERRRQFRVLPTDDVPTSWTNCARCPTIGSHAQSVAEKGFSLGCFDPGYLAEISRRRSSSVAGDPGVCHIWPGWSGRRYRPISCAIIATRHERDGSTLHAPDDLGPGRKAIAGSSLGMAPMSGFERSPVAPLWAVPGACLYEHGAPLYNFQGLRAFKNKFDPVWESKYLVYPGGLALLRIAADVSALVSGGYRRIFAK